MIKKGQHHQIHNLGSDAQDSKHDKKGHSSNQPHGPQLVSCTWRPAKEKSHETTSEFFVICDNGMPAKYRKGEASLAETVDSFDIFTRDFGTNGPPCKPRKAQLLEAFNSTDESAIIDKIIREGVEAKFDAKILNGRRGNIVIH
ncbi:hypothetical protein MIR68_002803 [Amoeboaphelidium protococcarum]|nr:hypothetical protein MIR68_002803 [Amoeboaphelidium protococcarum]KAI3647959.1 hypothetical protein MP228_008180 [Amoeboaphelidium protococcarum]KAI3653653.1 hypothetical protein MP228_001600 [Amoeboaphelidium protococcarum]